MHKNLIFTLLILVLLPFIGYSENEENEEKEYSKLAMINDYGSPYKTIMVGEKIWLKTLQNRKIYGVLTRVNFNSIVVNGASIPLSQIKKVRLKSDASTKAGCCAYGIGIGLVLNVVLNSQYIVSLNKSNIDLVAILMGLGLISGVGLMATGLPTYRDGRGFNVSLHGSWTLVAK